MRKDLTLSMLLVLLIFLSIKVSAQTEGDYRSVETGNWGTAGSWERFDGTDWVAAPTAPTSTDGVITILAGHNITIAAPVTADQIVVDAGSTLTMNSDLTLANGAGDDLTINGTFIWNNSTIGGPGNVIVTAVGNFILATTDIKYISTPITINGTMNWQDGEILFDATTSSLTNNGTIIISANNTIQKYNGDHGTLQNNGTITKTSTGTTIFKILTVNNAGTINLNAGTLSNQSSTWNNEGTLNFNTGIFNNFSNFKHKNGSLITGTGMFNNTDVGNLKLDDDLEFPSTVLYNHTSDLAYVNGDGNLTINNNFTMLGIIQGFGTLTINGNITWNSGWISRHLTIETGRNLTLATSNQKTINASLTINGTMDWQDGNIEIIRASSTLTNNGTITISGNNNISFNNDDLLLQNNGTITKSSTGPTSFILSTVNNAGTINLNQGTLTNLNGTWNNTGTLSFNNDAIFSNNGFFNHNSGSGISGTGSFNNGSTLNLNTDLVFPPTLVYMHSGSPTVQGSGNLTINNNFTMVGNILGTGTLTINGNITWNSGTIARALTISGGDSLTLATTGQKYISAPITINGLMDWQDGDIYFNSNTTLTNNRATTISGNNTIQNNTGTGTLQNNGVIAKTSTGTTTFSLGTVNNIAIVKGVGTFAMNNTTFTNNGIIAPGLSQGLLTMNTNQPLSASSTLQIEIQDGSGAGTGHDQLIRNGSITLAGTLTVTETGTVPNGTYTIISLTSGTVSGSFASTNLPPDYTLQITSTEVNLVKSSPLPLRLISFNAVIDAANNVKLNWVTDNEINTSHFDVERSTDGIQYEKIGVVAAANTGGAHTYTYADAQAQQGISYYRLKQIDRDGRFEYSPVRAVKNDNSTDILLLPNPVVDNLQLRGVATGTYIQVYDALGKQVLLQTWNGTPVQVSKLPTGMYTLHILSNNNTIVKKFLKQ